MGPAPFFVAGIINVTPDSFYDGGKNQEFEAAVANGRRLLEEGAHILDVGGESTRPFADPVDEKTESERVIPVIEALAEAVAGYPGAQISVDTYKAKVAAKALDAGATIVNDVSAFRFEPELLDVLAEKKPGYVLMHSLSDPTKMQVAPSYENVMDEITAFFEERMAVLTKAGLPEENIVLDPGIGFGKNLEHNLEIMRNMERFHALGRPLYVGLSNKSVWQKLLGLDSNERGAATLAATVLMALRGVGVHRVHEVAPAVQALETTRHIWFQRGEDKADA
jgi:dihydropteroate synthase